MTAHTALLAANKKQQVSENEKLEQPFRSELHTNCDGLNREFA